MRVDVVGVPRVTGPDGAVAGSRLGGRRAHAVLAALALDGSTLSAERLAELVGGQKVTVDKKLRFTVC